jgi:hypothetical protein
VDSHQVITGLGAIRFGAFLHVASMASRALPGTGVSGRSARSTGAAPARRADAAASLLSGGYFGQGAEVLVSPIYLERSPLSHPIGLTTDMATAEGRVRCVDRRWLSAGRRASAVVFEPGPDRLRIRLKVHRRH